MSHIKIFERVSRGKITNHLNTQQLYNQGQYGFKAGQPCLSQLLDNYEMILDLLEDSMSITSSFFKIGKISSLNFIMSSL